MIDDAVKFDGICKYESSFELAFRDGVVWECQDQIFTMLENKEVKGQHQRKGKVDPQLELKSTTAKKIDLTIEEAADDIEAHTIEINARNKRRATTCIRLV